MTFREVKTNISTKVTVKVYNYAKIPLQQYRINELIFYYVRPPMPGYDSNTFAETPSSRWNNLAISNVSGFRLFSTAET
jgi:hypothetical protein